MGITSGQWLGTAIKQGVSSGKMAALETLANMERIILLCKILTCLSAVQAQVNIHTIGDTVQQLNARFSKIFNLFVFFADIFIQPKMGPHRL